jgi:hypothetical protein
MANCVRSILIPGIPGKPETWKYRRCTQPATQSRRITALITLEDSPSVPNLEYDAALCAEHAREYDEA